ncbi:3-deoxy-7-phosphoheptulonate synthase [Gallaecimonas xiamenensis]|uniref:Phospho-2-dehydro-3-deoxyheptonate aldolase n=1 Tax=Gallaecimonas xiamenensis 3-C-1 TaxID=745411 RepID=K2KKM0_9GAMM|nr:3-deoxy-7-phosphoheptulonate synthase [Gallaecimonas xiamenensis]EKE77955.1 phospho-2-dehydro-3-deoxyheptonate aldolase [Gallaecimonas xiamenensis 3-C-1]
MTFLGTPLPLVSPGALKASLALTDPAAVAAKRQAISDILTGKDDRLMVVIGPCSVHDPKAALEYGQRLAAIQARYQKQLLLVMRVYFEKPRTRHGWKGLVYDPELCGQFDVNQGLTQARQLLLDLHQLGLPLATEFLDLTTGHYLADLVSWGAIGARTTESQVHRALASALPCPVGFKNGTDGNVRIAIDAIRAAADSHLLFGPNDQGQLQALASAGNAQTHLILRGGLQPNYQAQAIEAACAALRHAALPERLMVDCSHGNSRKEYQRQHQVAADIGAQLAAGEHRIFGVMVESFLEAGSQPEGPKASLSYGKSITDACLGWDESLVLLDGLAKAVQGRRQCAKA